VASKVKLLARSSVLRIAQTVIGIIIGFLMMPFLIRTLGEDLYGLWIVIASLVGTYYLLDMGFAPAITRYVAKFIHQQNPKGANRVINTALVIYSCLGLVVFLASVVAAHFGAGKLMEGSEHVELAQVLLMIMGLSLAIEFPAKSFPGIISAYLRYDVIAIAQLIKSVVDALLIYWLLSNGHGLVTMSLITFITGLLSTSFFVYYANSLFPQIKYSKSLIDINTFKDVFHFSKWAFICEVNNVIRDKMDIWFIAFYQSNAVLTAYYVSVRLIEYALQFLAQATGFTGPIFTEYYAKGETEKLQRAVRAFIKINLMLGSVFLVGFSLVGESFIRLWMGDEFSYHQAWQCLVILSLGRFSVHFSAPLQSLLMTFNRHKIGAWVSILENLSSAVLLWLLVPRFGIQGAAIAIALPLAIGKLIIIPAFVAPMISLGFASLAVRTLVFAGITFAAVELLVWMLPNLKQLTLMQLLLASPAIGLVQLSIGIILFNQTERQWILQQLQRRWRKRASTE
jgi:O-antigen/teichoic acid export membrane protein